MPIHIVVTEYRDVLDRVVEEIDSVFGDKANAQARADAINSDYERYPSHVAGVETFAFSDFDLQPRRVTARIGVQAGAGNANAKLTPDDVREIRRLKSQGWIQADIARHFGVHPVTVSQIIRGERWKHVK